MANVAQAGSAVSAGKDLRAYIPLFILPATAILLSRTAPSWAFMWALSFGIFAGLKWMTWWKARQSGAGRGLRSVAYLLAWPGMDAAAFLDSRVYVAKPRLNQWATALGKTAFGFVLLYVLARRLPIELPLLRGWIGLLGLIFLLHFGSFHLMALFWQAIGINAQPIMSKPLLSKSLSDFWGKRWNLGFRQLAHEFVFVPLHRRLGVPATGFLVFVLSGLIHDLVISVPARDGYGLPTAYFAIQGFGVAAERSVLGRRLGVQNGMLARIFTFVLTAGPACWLFHPPFVLRVIIPFMKAIHCL